jgi:hypothetical protein
MVCRHREYKLGDEEPSDRFQDIPTLARFCAGTSGIWMPLYLLDHSGLWMRTGKFHEDTGGWDTSLVGIIFVTKQGIIDEFGDDSPESRELAAKLLQSEVETYNQYLSHDVYGYVVEDDEENNVDSCWGFFGWEYAKEEAKRALHYYVEHHIAVAPLEVAQDA